MHHQEENNYQIHIGTMRGLQVPTLEPGLAQDLIGCLVLPRMINK